MVKSFQTQSVVAFIVMDTPPEVNQSHSESISGGLQLTAFAQYTNLQFIARGDLGGLPTVWYMSPEQARGETRLLSFIMPEP